MNRASYAVKNVIYPGTEKSFSVKFSHSENYTVMPQKHIMQSFREWPVLVLKYWSKYAFLILVINFFLLLNIGHLCAQKKSDEIHLSPYNKLHTLDIKDVNWNEGFWKERFDLVHNIIIPHMYDYFDGKSHDIGISMLGSNQILNNFRIAAGFKDGNFSGSKWGDGDFYKWFESLAYVYALTRDEALDSLMDELIIIIGKAQQSDGYINTQITIPGIERFAEIQNHETYNMGHLILASCAHYKATGKTSFLEIGKKAGDCLYNAFIDPSVHFIGYTSIMGLIELFRVTGEKNYLDLALEFINKHGNGGKKEDQIQNRTPIREEVEALGHAVWGTYLFCGATDLIAETGEKELIEAMNRIWDDLHEKKFYITGGVSAAHHGITTNGDRVHEAFGQAYDLPNAEASNETCSHIGDAMWNYRMLKLTGDSKYVDVIETILYNSFLAGMGLEGKTYFYTNPLERFGAEGVFLEDDTMIRWLHRSGWCCPPNILRIIANINSWFYSISDEGLYVNLYGANILESNLMDGSHIKVTQETNYPWDGNIKLSLDVPEKKTFSIFLRVPDWAVGAEVYVNKKKVKQYLLERGYIEINRSWVSGDIVQLELPMKVEIIRGNPLVKENLNKVAVKRGPIVYCLESPDMSGGIPVKDVVIPQGIKFKSTYDKFLLGGITFLEGKALVKSSSGNSETINNMMPQSTKKMRIKLIPYFSWANRGISYMTIWLPAEPINE